MRINQATLKLIMEFEGLHLEAYRDPIGVWTIGYGHSERAPLPPVPVPGMRITKGEAEEILARDLEHFATQMRPLFTRHATANQFGAMLSLAFNIGLGAFAKSTCLRRFNSGDIDGAAEALTWFNKAGGKVWRGLVRRREAEKALFLSGEVASIVPDPEEAGRTSPAQSTTLQAAVGQVGAAGAGAMAAFNGLDGTAQIVALAVCGAVVLLAMWIARERLKKWADGVR